jgi:selenocysteine lyase/cysteine desulfurase
MFGELKRRELLSEEIAQRTLHSSIYNLQINEFVYHGLLEKNVRCIKRGEGVRVALHHYNTQNDITTFFKIIDALL